MSGQKQQNQFLKNSAAGLPFRSQNSGSSQQQAFSPGPSNNQGAARSRSPLRLPWTTAGAASPTAPVVVSTPAIISGDAGAAVTATSTAASTLATSPGDDQTAEAAVPSNLQSLWERSLTVTVKRLSEKGLPPPKHAHPPAREIVQLTIDDLKNAIKQNGKSVALQRLQGILKTFDSYAQIVDVAIQHNPEVAFLVWAGVREILQVTLNHMKVTESLEQFIAIIAEKMALCDFYASVYSEISSDIILLSAEEKQGFQKKLDFALPELYAAVLVFSVKAHLYFDPLTSRTILAYMLKPFSNIQSAVNAYLGLNIQQQYSVDFIAEPRDIRVYIDNAIAQHTNPDAMSEQLREEILTTVTEKSQGIFLLAALHMRMILEQQTIGKMGKALKDLPGCLDKAFLEELSHALAVKRGTTKLDDNNIPPKKVLLECCLGLVTLDEGTLTVRFAHRSVEEYFKQHAATHFPNRYSTAAEICLT